MECRAEYCTLLCAGPQLKLHAQGEISDPHSEVKFSASLLTFPPPPWLFFFCNFTHFIASRLWLLGLTKSTDSGQRELTVCL